MVEENKETNKEEPTKSWKDYLEVIECGAVKIGSSIYDVKSLMEMMVWFLEQKSVKDYLLQVEKDKLRGISYG